MKFNLEFLILTTYLTNFTLLAHFRTSTWLQTKMRIFKYPQRKSMQKSAKEIAAIKAIKKSKSMDGMTINLISTSTTLSKMKKKRKKILKMIMMMMKAVVEL